MRIPSRITAGDDITWRDELVGCFDGVTPTPGTHALGYSFRGADAAAKLDISAIVDGGAWVSEILAEKSAAFNTTSAKVIWYWQAYATANDGGARTLVGDGQLTVLPNLALLATFDGRSPAEQALAAINAAIMARAAGGMVIDYTIGSRSLKREPITGLLELKTRYENIVRREKTRAAIANGLGNPNKSFVRFSK